MINTNHISSIVGYTIKPKDLVTGGQILPSNIAILAQANTDKQAGQRASSVITSSTDAGKLYGYGSPLHTISRQLFDKSDINARVVAIPQLHSGTASVFTATLSGSAISSANEKIVINGELIGYYSVSVGDTLNNIASSIAKTVSLNINSRVTALAIGNEVQFTAKWEGLTGSEIVIDFEDGINGISYAISNTTAGSGTGTLSTEELDKEWFTWVINSYGEAFLTDLETLNGTPISRTGKYAEEVFKPFRVGYSLWDQTNKTVEANIDRIIASTDARKEGATAVFCPAPNSRSSTGEVVASWVAEAVKIEGSEPHRDVTGKTLLGIDVADVGDFKYPEQREKLVKAGASTVSHGYTIEDFVTTYHPDNDNGVRAQFRFVRNLNLDWNIRYAYKILEEKFVKSKTLIKNGEAVTVDNTLSPAGWKSIIATSFIEDIASRALITDRDYSIDSIEVSISSTNPKRLETTFGYKRTETASVLDTVVEASFYTTT